MFKNTLHLVHSYSRPISGILNVESMKVSALIFLSKTFLCTFAQRGEGQNAEYGNGEPTILKCLGWCSWVPLTLCLCIGIYTVVAHLTIFIRTVGAPRILSRSTILCKLGLRVRSVSWSEQERKTKESGYLK